MDFFGAQDQARRKTWQLAALFGAAVLSLIFFTNLLVAVVYAWTTSYARLEPMRVTGLLQNLPAEYWGWISFGVIGAVAVASLYKYFLLRGGGRAIAESLGGIPLTRDSADKNQRRLLNVVEEMAIASGGPVPPVYLIREPSINAFAAGFSPDDAVIGVNQGTIDHLSRDELQGVIGHEFSHILNGDMRLNLRLMAVLFGILFIGLVGRGLLHGVGHISRRSSSRGSSSGGAPVLALGVGFLVIGYAGTFFGNLIKAAVSRQREFLADASSVQFTRNPGGLAGALKKIGGLSVGSTIRTAAAGEASHMFFGQIGPMFLNRYMATHPPLEERILVIEPRWDGNFPILQIPSAGDGQAATASATAEHPGAAEFATAPADPQRIDPQRISPQTEALLVMADPNAVTEAVGLLNEQSLNQAIRLIHSLTDELREAAHDPFACRAIFYALVLNEEPAIRSRQLDLIEANAEPGVPLEVLRLYPEIHRLTEPPTLVLVELAMPALKRLSQPQYRRFLGNLVALIRMDRQIDLMEWVLHRVLMKELKPYYEGATLIRERFNRLEDLREQAMVLIAALARHADDGGSPPAHGQVSASVSDAFAAGIAKLALEPEQTTDEVPERAAFRAEDRDNPYLLADDPNFLSLNAALGKLRALKPLQKPRLIKACAAAVLADGAASGRQGALLQGIAATLDCPLPPSIYGSAARDY